MESNESINVRQIVKDFFPATAWKVRKMILSTQKNTRGETKIYIEELKYDTNLVKNLRKQREGSPPIYGYSL